VSLEEACNAVQAITVQKPNNLMPGKKSSKTFEPLGACDNCDLRCVFDHIMKKVKEDLEFKLDLSSYKLV
jgi:hypothetical protein